MTPKGFSLIKSKSALIEDSAWTGRRYILLSEKGNEESALSGESHDFITSARIFDSKLALSTGSPRANRVKAFCKPLRKKQGLMLILLPKEAVVLRVPLVPFLQGINYYLQLLDVRKSESTSQYCPF